jgi:predicted transglutaminase-like cysteine proteinase
MTANRFITAFAAAALLATGAAPAFAKAQDSQGNGSSAAAQSGERKTCKVFEMTGSRTRAERVCLTKSQWKEFDAIR